MSHYTCKIGTPDGRILTRAIEAAGPEQLRISLEEEGYTVFTVRKRSFGFLSGSTWKRRKVTTRSLLHFNQEMLVLLRAGMPLLQILDTILQRQDGGQLSVALRHMRDDVKGGDALSTALERQSLVFSNLYIASIRSGERTGELIISIQRYMQYLKKTDCIRRKLVSALFYPCILAVVSILAIALLLFYVIPVFSRIFIDAGSQLPLLTQMLITFTNFLQRFAFIGLLMAIAATVLFRIWAASDTGRQKIDELKLKSPYAGEVFKEYSLASFCRTLANLLGSGMPIIVSLRMSLGTLNNVYMETCAKKATREIEEGGKLSTAFERTGILPPLAVQMLVVGESTGALEEMLTNISEYLEESLDERLHYLTAAIEPAIMIAMGLVIGVLIIAMYLPIFQLAGTMG